MNNTYQYAAEIAQRTGKDRANTHKTLQKLLEKIGAEFIESIEHNNDLTVITINGVRCERPTKRWIIQNVHQPIPTPEVVESKSLTVTEPEVDQSIALAMSMMSFTTEDNKKVEKQEPYYVGDRIHVASGEDGTKYMKGGILVEHAPDSCVDDPTEIDTKACVSTLDGYKQKLINLYLSNGYSQYDAEVSANAQMNAFTVVHDPELTGTYERTADDSFLFNGKEVKFNEEDMEFQM
jgi:hypothetical protein